MKITIDKKFTTLEMVERTKEQAKEFKEMYTDGDLLRIFMDTFDNDIEVNPEIVRCELSAFPGGTMETDENHYSVNILLEGWRRFWKLHFYISQSGEVDTREVWDGDKMVKMWDIEEYRLVE